MFYRKEHLKASPFVHWPAWLLQHESSTWVICIFWRPAPLLDDPWTPNNIHAFPCSAIVPQTKRNSTLTWPPSFASYTSNGQENKLSWNWNDRLGEAEWRSCRQNCIDLSPSKSCPEPSRAPAEQPWQALRIHDLADRSSLATSMRSVLKLQRP